MRTSSPRRCIWIRIPSSFHSTEARSKPATASATLAAVEASIGRTGRKSSKPTSRSPSSPSPSAISAVRGRSPDSISARRVTSPETPAARATASTISPASAPCLSSPVKRRRTKSASALRSRGRAARRGSPCARPPTRRRSSPGPRDRAIELVRPSATAPRQRRALDACRSSSTRPRPGPAEARPQKPDADGTSLRIEPLQELGEDRDLPRARARVCHAPAMRRRRRRAGSSRGVMVAKKAQDSST